MIFKLIFIFFLILNLGNDTFAQSSNFVCNKKNAKEFAAQIEALLKNKNLSLENIIQGQPASMTLVHIWGQEIDFAKTKEVIDELRKALKEKSTVPQEYDQLTECLEKFKLNKELERINKESEVLIQNKISYLERNKELKNLISSSAESSSTIPSLKNQVDQQKAEVEKLKDSIEREVLLTEVKLAKVEDSIEKEIIAYKSRLDKVKLEIIKVNENYVNSLEKHLTEYEKQTLALAQVTAKLRILKTDEIIQEYQLVSQIWEKVVLDAFKQIQSEASKFNFPEIPPTPKVLKDVSEEKKVELKLAYDEVLALKNKSIIEVTDRKSKEVEVQSNLLLQVNLVRSELFRDIPFSYFAKEVFSSKFWGVIKLEIIASPYRVISFFFNKYLYIKKQVSQGLVGYRKLSLGLIALLFLGVLFWIFNKLIIFTVVKFNAFIKYLVVRFKYSKVIKYLGKLWLKLKDSAEEILWIFTLNFLLTLESFSDLRLIIEFVIIILFYRILKHFIVVGLGIVSSVDTFSFVRFKNRAEQTSNSVGKVFLFYAVSMLFLEGVLGKTYIYSFINFATLVFVISLLVKISTDWENEIEDFLEKNISGLIVEKIQKSTVLLPRRLKAITYLFFLSIFSLFNLLIYLTEDFEISKKISANIFKKQLESLEAEEGVDTELPTDYKVRFSLKSLDSEEDFVMPESNIIDLALTDIQEWKERTSEEHSLLIYGDKGVGKTTLVKHLIKKSQELGIKTIYSKVPSKILTKEKLVSFLLTEMGLGDQCETFDPSLVDTKLEEPVVIFLDEAQNSFLSESGGFDAYYALLNIVNLDMKNVFWVFAMNKYSWLYLDKAFGKNQFFRNVYPYQGWSDSKIKELIMKRHNNTSYKLSYDVLINVTKSEDEVDRYTTIENKFFKLLWEMSSGNPRAALYLWLKSLKRKRHHLFNVYVPRLNDEEKLHDMTDSTLFVLAHVLKHENLSLKEIERTTNLPLGICRNSVKVSLEKDLLYKDERNRFMIDLKRQYQVIKHLKSKNFIYGS